MAITASVFVNGEFLTTTEEQLYSAENLSKITASVLCNVSSYDMLATIWIGGSAIDQKMVIKNHRLRPTERFTCPEIINQVINIGGGLWARVRPVDPANSATNAVTFRVSGIEIT